MTVAALCWVVTGAPVIIRPLNSVLARCSLAALGSLKSQVSRKLGQPCSLGLETGDLGLGNIESLSQKSLAETGVHVQSLNSQRAILLRIETILEASLTLVRPVLNRLVGNRRSDYDGIYSTSNTVCTYFMYVLIVECTIHPYIHNIHPWIASKLTLPRY